MIAFRIPFTSFMALYNNLLKPIIIGKGCCMTLIEKANAWAHSNRRMALAIVVKTWGSAPRQAGAVMLVRDDSRVEGSVSGGCVEADVIETALDAIKTNRSFLREFGVADEKAWTVGLSCGGRISVLVTPVDDSAFPAAYLEQASTAIGRRDPLDLILTLKSENKVSVTAQVPDPSLSAETDSRYDDAECQFTWRFRPAFRLVIIGAGHIGQVLSQLARQVGFAVEVVDPRSMFAARERFPDVEIHVGWPQDLLPGLGIDAQTAMVTLTHDPKIDDPALVHALGTKAFYLGCLGSRRTHEARCHRLEAEGFTRRQLDRLHGPAGLPLGGRSVPEIALAILAELVAARYSA